ncbi:LuxR C-terminal-related transcriptional regulator [Pseudomonas guariconensis]|uniref:LuxR C-terminal-related transcriptional regulator n=1 Tax=Pseudomonas guariconensis TaxID=1288410 RepID=UPI0036F38A15
MAAGASVKEVARQLGIGFTTVRTHLNNAMAKLERRTGRSWPVMHEKWVAIIKFEETFCRRSPLPLCESQYRQRGYPHGNCRDRHGGLRCSG